MSSHSVLIKMVVASSMALYATLAVSASRPSNKPVVTPVAAVPKEQARIDSTKQPVTTPPPGGGGDSTTGTGGSSTLPFPVVTTCASGQASRC